MALFDNKYIYIKELGEGGFGRVFLAEEMHSKNLVAIKQLKNQNKRDQEVIISEMQTVSKFNHPHVVNYKHHFVQEGTLFIVMEYCSKGSLRLYIKKEEIKSTFVWKWFEQLTETLQLLHDKGTVHHDIKPDNILFTEDRLIKLADFGIANTCGGTRAYMSPEALTWEKGLALDPRVDIYALGVTLIEVLTGTNPFHQKSAAEINELHDLKQFGITHLANWQQEIILKAISKIPEQRFQSMKEFHEALQARVVPVIFDKEAIQAGDLAEKAGSLLNKKKWQRALALLDHAEKAMKPNVNVLYQKGRFYLLARQIDLAKSYYDKALKWNPRLDVQKDLGWINLELQNYPTAISLLSDHVHRNPSDFEAYNLLLQCYYETNRYEQAIELAKTLLEVDPYNHCFVNNYYVCLVMQNIGSPVSTDLIVNASKSGNHFLKYNSDLVFEEDLTHNFNEKPTLKSKLLFMDYRFNKYSSSNLYATNGNYENFVEAETSQPIITFGRENYLVNNVKVPGGAAISRRHCVVINYKDDIWIYDLNSTGTYVNGRRIDYKAPLIGKNTIRLGKVEYELTNDKGKLF